MLNTMRYITKKIVGVRSDKEILDPIKELIRLVEELERLPFANSLNHKSIAATEAYLNERSGFFARGRNHAIAFLQVFLDTIKSAALQMRRQQMRRQLEPEVDSHEPITDTTANAPDADQVSDYEEMQEFVERVVGHESFRTLPSDLQSKYEALLSELRRPAPPPPPPSREADSAQTTQRVDENAEALPDDGVSGPRGNAAKRGVAGNSPDPEALREFEEAAAAIDRAKVAADAQGVINAKKIARDAIINGKNLIAELFDLERQQKSKVSSPRRRMATDDEPDSLTIELGCRLTEANKTFDALPAVASPEQFEATAEEVKAVFEEIANAHRNAFTQAVDRAILDADVAISALIEHELADDNAKRARSVATIPEADRASTTLKRDLAAADEKARAALKNRIPGDAVVAIEDLQKIAGVATNALRRRGREVITIASARLEILDGAGATDQQIAESNKGLRDRLSRITTALAEAKTLEMVKEAITIAGRLLSDVTVAADKAKADAAAAQRTQTQQTGDRNAAVLPDDGETGANTTLKARWIRAKVGITGDSPKPEQLQEFDAAAKAIADAAEERVRALKLRGEELNNSANANMKELKLIVGEQDTSYQTLNDKLAPVSRHFSEQLTPVELEEVVKALGQLTDETRVALDTAKATIAALREDAKNALRNANVAITELDSHANSTARPGGAAADERDDPNKGLKDRLSGISTALAEAKTLEMVKEVVASAGRLLSDVTVAVDKAKADAAEQARRARESAEADKRQATEAAQRAFQAALDRLGALGLSTPPQELYNGVEALINATKEQHLGQAGRALDELKKRLTPERIAPGWASSTPNSVDALRQQIQDLYERICGWIIEKLTKVFSNEGSAVDPNDLKILAVFLTDSKAAEALELMKKVEPTLGITNTSTDESRVAVCSRINAAIAKFAERDAATDALFR